MIERGNGPTIDSKLPKVVALAIGPAVSNDSYVETGTAYDLRNTAFSRVLTEII